MKTKQFSRWFSLTLLIAMLFVAVIPVAADGGDGGDDSDSLWGEVLNPDGTIRYDNLIDQGVQVEDASWMPSVLGIGGQAEYHLYETPSGTIVQLPTATTLFFMALNPVESGINDASSSQFTGAGTLLALPGVISAVLQGANIDLSGTEYVSADQYADALIAGDTDIWSLGLGDLWNITASLAQASMNDFLGDGELNLYTALLLYTPDNIPDEILDLLPDDITIDDIPPLPPTCPAGVAVPGAISTSGTMIAPNYPLVVGQDPDKRGVDLSFSASVAPTTWTYYEQVPVFDDVCKALNDTPISQSDCTRESGNPGIMRNVIVDWSCEVRTEIYPETIPVAYASATLSSDSRDWILDTLSLRYPGAYIHKGSFRYPSSAGGSTWNFEQLGVQIQDPGTWNLSVGGRTSGTPVSDSRNFGGDAGSFQVYLKEIAIVQ